MELKQQLSFEVVKDSNRYYFTIPNSATYGEAYDVCIQVLNELVAMQKKTVEALESQKENSELKKNS